MTRRVWIERCLRQIYNGPINDEATITVNLVNVWLQTAIGIAAKANYKDALAIDGIGYVNNSFYTTYRGISITADEQFTWKVEVPEIPLGVGNTEGISQLVLKDSGGQQTLPVVLISENQRTFYRSMRPIPNKVLGYPEGKFVYVVSTLILTPYTASITMISGGDSTNLDSVLNVPSDYDPIMIDYVKQQLMFERGVPIDATNDGLDAIKTT